MQTANVNKKYNIHSRFCTGSLIMEKLKKAMCPTYLQQKTHLLAQARLGVVSIQRWLSMP